MMLMCSIKDNDSNGIKPSFPMMEFEYEIVDARLYVDADGFIGVTIFGCASTESTVFGFGITVNDEFFDKENIES